MRIYLSGAASVGVLAPWTLESFRHLTAGTVERIREQGATVFIDSGAFTRSPQATRIEVSRYADFLERHADLWHLAASLDVIGTGCEELSWRHLRHLERSSLKVLPVHHYGDEATWLPFYLDHGYQYLALGGMVGRAFGSLKSWLDRMWSDHLLKHPAVKVHGFGLTDFQLMFRYPWASVDSTSWLITSRHGRIYLDYPQARRVVSLPISDQSSQAHHLDQHFDSLTHRDQERVRARIEALGFDVEGLRRDYRARDRWNVAVFERLQEWPVDLRWYREAA